jgi:hypothetical protein
MRHNAPTQRVPVGTPVWFLQQGRDNVDPLPATVISMSENLVARLSIIDSDGGQSSKMAVYPLGHPSLRDQNGSATQGAIRNGAWTYHPLFAPAEKTEEAADGIESQVMEAYEELRDLDAVARKFRSKGLKKSEVEAIVGS